MKKIDGDLCHSRLLAKAGLYELKNHQDYSVWKKAIGQKLQEVLGDRPLVCDLEITIEYRIARAGYDEIRFVYNSEQNCPVPAYLLIPHNIPAPMPVVICLQGHSTGMHISLGVAKYPDDDKQFHAAHGLNAVKNGFAALIIEQRGMGERKSDITHDDHFAAYTALLLGRTLIGERVWDISRGIDALAHFAEIDLDKIMCLGNSGGGTATYYAAACDERIKIAVASCAISTYRASIGAMYHCPCNYIPGAAKWFDMGDLGALIAPRKLVIVSGVDDPIFPIESAREVFGVIEKIYARENSPEMCEMIVTDKGHWFCEDIIWPRLKEICEEIL